MLTKNLRELDSFHLFCASANKIKVCQCLVCPQKSVGSSPQGATVLCPSFPWMFGFPWQFKVMSFLACLLPMIGGLAVIDSPWSFCGLSLGKNRRIKERTNRTLSIDTNNIASKNAMLLKIFASRGTLISFLGGCFQGSSKLFSLVYSHCCLVLSLRDLKDIIVFRIATVVVWNQ